MRGRELLVEHTFAITTAEKQESIDALEVAIDAFLADNAIDAIDRHSVALDDEPRTFFAVHVFENVDAIVHCITEMGRRPP